MKNRERKHRIHHKKRAGVISSERFTLTCWITLFETHFLLQNLSLEFHVSNKIDTNSVRTGPSE